MSYNVLGINIQTCFADLSVLLGDGFIAIVPSFSAKKLVFYDIAISI